MSKEVLEEGMKGAWRKAIDLINDQDAEIHELKKALKSSMVAIDDWLHVFAPEHCNKDCVDETRRRTNEYGTVAYIAKVQEQNREALK